MRNAFKNTSYNAIGFILPVILALATTPYILHKLTAEIYGIYVLCTSLMGLMAFLDLGFGQGIIKFVAEDEAKKDYDAMNSVINTSLIIYLSMGIIGMLSISLLSGLLSARVFKIPEQEVMTAKIAFRITAIGFFLSFLRNAFANIPKALQRYDISVKIQNAIWFSYLLSVIMLLRFGYGLIAMLVANVFFLSIGIVVNYIWARKLLPFLVIGMRFETRVFKRIFGFSVFAAINSITGNIVFRVDKLIIGWLLGVEAVAYYNVPFMVVQMTNGFITAISQFLFPAVSHIDSLGDKARLTRVYRASIRYDFALSATIAVGLIVLGGNFLTLWMGKAFALRSAFLVPVLAIVFFFNSTSTIGFWFYNGLGHSKINMLSSLVGTTAYLATAFILIPKFGLMGAALSFIFILIPYPVYNYILNKMVGTSQKWFLNVLAKSLVPLVFSLVLRRYVSLPSGIWIFLVSGLVIVVVIFAYLYVVKIISNDDIRGITGKLRVSRTET